MKIINIESGYDTISKDCLSSTQGGLIVDPEDRTVYTWWNVGAGTPMSVFERRAILVSFNPSVTTVALKDWVSDNEELLEEICEGYLGEQFDGNNYRGRWKDEIQDTIDRLSNQDGGQSDLAQHCDAADWFAGDPYTVVKEAAEGGSIAEAVDCIVHAASGEVELDPVDVEEALRDLLEGERESVIVDGDKIIVVDNIDCGSLEEVRRQVNDLVADNLPCVTPEDWRRAAQQVDAAIAEVGEDYKELTDALKLILGACETK